jgi:hypothetical protein
VFWGGELFAVKYFALGERVAFDGIPKADAIEVRTRVVEAAPKMRRNGWDLPWGALAIVAALSHAMVVASVVKHDGPKFGGSPPSARDDERIASYYDSFGDAVPEPASFIGLSVASAKEEDAPAGGREDDTPAARERREALGMVGLLSQFRGDGDSAMWAPEAHGLDGKMWGDAIGESFGVAGISLSGVGEGGGGNGNTLGNVLDHVHTDASMGMGYGNAHGHLAGTHTSTIVCHLTYSTPISCTRMAPEVIQRVVRTNEGRFRACYIDGLKRDPKLAGRVVTKFVIGRDGLVQTATDAGSDLPDARVVSCVAHAFTALEFPESPDGVATVTYPFDMQPSE